MTREEAITYLEDAKSDLPYMFEQALDMAIEALSAQLDLQPTCNQLATTEGDLISRQDAIDAWWHDEVFFGNQRDDMTKEQWLDYITDIIGSLPSAGSCKGCKHQGQWENEYEMGYPSPCTVCMRRSKDNYEK